MSNRLSYGEVIFSVRHDSPTDEGRLHIDRADPRSRIAAEFVINWGERRPDYIECTGPGVFTIRDDYGQRFIYRVDFEDFDPLSQSYGMEWPD